MRSIVWRIPGLKQLRRSGWLNHKLRLGYGAYWGAFPSREDAVRFLRPSRLATADNEDMAVMNVEAFSTVHSFDWPIMFFMMDFKRRGRLTTVTDLGGHLGVKYHAFRKFLALPKDTSWQVVDVPAVCKEGRRRQRSGETSLQYFEDPEKTAPCDVLLCSGVLQYLDYSLVEAVARLPSRPRLILLNKVAISRDSAFYTLESLGRSRIPYHVTTIADLDRARDALGYRLLSRWSIPDRIFEAATANGKQSIESIGEVWIANGITEDASPGIDTETSLSHSY